MSKSSEKENRGFRTSRIPHPAIIYLLLSIAVLLTSWIGSIFEMRDMTRNGDLILRSLLNIQGIRWIVRTAAQSLSQAPIGNALLIIISIGSCRASGIFKSIFHGKLSPKERNALIISTTALTLYLMLIGFGLFGSSHLLLGVSGTLRNSPVLSGSVFLITIAILLVSIVFGLISDNLRTAEDCLNACTSALPETASFLITMLLASQLLSFINYSHLDQYLAITHSTMKIISFIIYWLPLPIIILRHQKNLR